MIRAIKILATAALIAGVASTMAVGATVRYEAEAPTNTFLNVAVRNDGSWWTGKGFVGGLGNGTNHMLTFNGVYASAAGDATLTMRYMTWGTRKTYISVNGGAASILSCPEGSGTNIGMSSITLGLATGKNTIAMWNPSDWTPDIDYIDMSGANIVSAPTPEPGSMMALAGLLAPVGFLARRKRA